MRFDVQEARNVPHGAPARKSESKDKPESAGPQRPAAHAGFSFSSVPINATVSRKETGKPDREADVSEAVGHGLSGGGRKLDPESRSFLKRGLGRDFGDVRVHTDSNASKSAEAISAKAYTVGSDIAFHEGEYEPGTKEGKRLLAHEAAHVLQNDSGKGGHAGGTVHRFFGMPGLGALGGAFGGSPAAPAADPMASAMFETGVVGPISRAYSGMKQKPPALQQSLSDINSASSMLETIQQTATSQNNEKLAMYSLSLNNALDQPRLMIMQELGSKFSPDSAAESLNPSDNRLGPYFDMIRTNLTAPAQPMIPPGALDPGGAPGPLDPGGPLMPGSSPIGAPGAAGPGEIPGSPLAPGIATPTPVSPVTPGAATPTPTSPFAPGSAFPSLLGTANVGTLGATVSGSGSAAETPEPSMFDRIRKQMMGS